MVTVGIVGFGEVGEALARDLLGRDATPRVLETRPGTQATTGRASALGLSVDRDPERFGAEVGLVVVVVPASEAPATARAVAPHLAPHVVYTDWTAKSPAVRDEIAVTCAGRRFADVAITDTVTWAGAPVELLVSGPGARDLAAVLDGSRFRANVIDEAVPRSSEIKLCRSAFTKGLSALMLESFVNAERLGVLDVVDDGLSRFLGEAYPRLRDLVVGTAVQHAARRATEMADAAAILTATLGHAPMTTASRDVLATLVAVRRAQGPTGAQTWREVVELLDAADVFATAGARANELHEPADGGGPLDDDRSRPCTS